MHGAAQTAKAAPSSALEPLARARSRTPPPTIRCGSGSSPMKPSPKTTRTKPATASWLRGPITSAIAAAAAPSATKTTVKPARNGRLATTTRRAVPGWPSREASTADTAER
jgi:hypothetical protein